MSFTFTEKHRTWSIVISILFFSLFALYLRLIPMFSMGNTDILNLVASDDPLYNLRQVELMLHNFPRYAWFDPMTHFPYGDSLYWGPLFTYLVAASCIVTGATTRPEIIGASLIVPPILGTLLVPILYFVGKSCGDWKTGLFASGFAAVVSGQFFYRSYYGYLDHHIAEVFFATIFCLAYIFALQAGKNTRVRFTVLNTVKRPAFIAALAGIAFLLGLFTMPTMILFAMIVAIFTLIQFIIDVYRGETGEYLVLINSVVFIVVIVPFLLFGIQAPNSLDLANYSIGHVYAYVSLIAGTFALYGIALLLKGRSRHLYPLALAGLGVAGSLLLFLASPSIFNLLVSSFFAFFGQVAESLTVEEAMSWDVYKAWSSFSYGLILMALGFAVLAYKNFREEHPYQIFVIVWSAVILVSTWQHIRYEYYLAINIALLAAVGTDFAVDLGWPEITGLLKTIVPDPVPAESALPENKRGRKQKKERGKQAGHRSRRNFAAIGIFLIIAAFAVLFVVNSVEYSYFNAMENPIRMNPDWRESLEWLGNNTPSTGVDYFTIYDTRTFQYPSSAYGVMSWWDYGHMITYIAKRIPNANPFQQGVAGDYGAAAFFMTTSEDSANAILDRLGTKYIVTDYAMDVGKFPAMATWFNATEGIKPYGMYVAVSDPDQPTTYQQVLLNNATYYQTMISRLHNFDGSMGEPTTAYYIEYADSSLTRVSVPLVTGAKEMNATEATARAAEFNRDAKAGNHAIVLNPFAAVYLPIEQVPALHNYRLIHESPTNVYDSSVADIRYVKVFEYVKGARIKGDGVIEVPVVTNTGRTFTYRQQSTNGAFIVPYSTTGNAYDVRTTGKYRISATSQEFDVPEDAVIRGMTIN